MSHSTAKGIWTLVCEVWKITRCSNLGLWNIETTYRPTIWRFEQNDRLRGTLPHGHKWNCYFFDPQDCIQASPAAKCSLSTAGSDLIPFSLGLAQSISYFNPAFYVFIRLREHKKSARTPWPCSGFSRREKEEFVCKEMATILKAKSLPSRPYSRRTKWNTDSWTWEILSCAFSIIATFAVAAVVYVYDGNPLPRFPFNIGVFKFSLHKFWSKCHSFELIRFSWVLSLLSLERCRKVLFYWL